jgi:hypothetical protein
MAVNQHNAVTFNDGEPLDPVKLNKLSQNIDNLFQMTSVSNQTDNSGNPAAAIVFTKYHKFEDVGAGKMDKLTFNFGDKFTPDEIKSGKVFAVASLRNSLTADDNMMVSVTGITTTPTIYVVNKGKKPRDIAVGIIAIVLREVVSAG